MLTVLQAPTTATLAEKLRKMDDIVDEPLHGDQALPDADQPRSARRKRRTALGRHRVVHDQHGAGRRHHRAHHHRPRGQEDRQGPRLLGRPGMEEICDLHGRLIANLRLGMSVFLHGDLKSAQRAARARRCCSATSSARTPDSHIERLTSNTTAEHRDLVAAPRHDQRFETHQLAYLLDRLSDS